MEVKKWLKKNWLIVSLLIVVLIFFIDDCSDDVGYRKFIRDGDKEIQKLMDDNRDQDKVIADSIEMADKAEAAVAEREATIAARDVRIRELQKKEAEVPEKVEAMDPPSVVLRTIEILGLDEIELRNDKVVFTLACAKRNLIFLDRGELIRQQRDDLSTSLTESQEALSFQKVATFYYYRIAWAQSIQRANWKAAYNKKDEQFKRADKERKRARFKGYFKGFMVGVIVTIVIIVLRGRR